MSIDRTNNNYITIEYINTFFNNIWADNKERELLLNEKKILIPIVLDSKKFLNLEVISCEKKSDILG
jgi:hypothetical protein